MSIYKNIFLVRTAFMSISKNFILIFLLVKTDFSKTFFSLYKILDSEYIVENYKIFKKINIGAIIKNPEMIQFVPDDFKNV